MRAARTTILPGRQTTIWGFEGEFPGPTIVARAGRRVVVRQTNGLDVPVTVHLRRGRPDRVGRDADRSDPTG